MKKLSVLFAGAILFMSAGVMKAQKIAVLDVATVLGAMPEKKKADDQLAAFSKAKEAELKKEGDIFQADVQKYQTEGAKMSEADRTKKEAELEKTQTALRKKATDAQEEFLKKRDAAYAPIEKKFNDAVSKVATANGWDFIIDKLSQDFIYKNGPDATPAVKKELNLP